MDTTMIVLLALAVALLLLIGFTIGRLKRLALLAALLLVAGGTVGLCLAYSAARPRTGVLTRHAVLR